MSPDHNSGIYRFRFSSSEFHQVVDATAMDEKKLDADHVEYA
jgi:hypothetical protein